MSAIYILWLRQLKRYSRSKSRIIGSLGQPLLFMVALGFGFGPIYAQSGGGNYIQFLVPGIVGMSIIFTALFTGIEIIWDRQFGFLKEILVAPISRTSIMIGRTLGGTTVAVAQGLIVLLLSLLVGYRPANLWLLPLALVFMFLIALVFTALGTVIASRLSDMQGFQLIINFLVMPLFFLSGALFPLNNVPQTLRLIAMADPLTYGIDGLRGALSGVSHIPMPTDLVVLSIISLALFFIGSYFFSKIEL